MVICVAWGLVCGLHISAVEWWRINEKYDTDEEVIQLELRHECEDDGGID